VVIDRSFLLAKTAASCAIGHVSLLMRRLFMRFIIVIIIGSDGDSSKEVNRLLQAGRHLTRNDQIVAISDLLGIDSFLGGFSNNALPRDEDVPFE